MPINSKVEVVEQMKPQSKSNVGWGSNANKIIEDKEAQYINKHISKAIKLWQVLLDSCSDGDLINYQTWEEACFPLNAIYNPPHW